jgi:hypothetical protein
MHCNMGDDCVLLSCLSCLSLQPSVSVCKSESCPLKEVDCKHLCDNLWRHGPLCVSVSVSVCAWATGAVSQIAGGGHTSSGPVPAFTNGDCVSARFSTVTALTFGPTPAGYGGDSVVTVYAAEPNSNILRSITVNAGGSGRYLPPPPPPTHTPVAPHPTPHTHLGARPPGVL